jgi:hypothetical protein
VRRLPAKVASSSLIALVALSLRADAQSAPPATVVTAAVRTTVTDSLAAELQRLYVDADTARLIADRIRSRARDGAYDAITDARRFSDALTTDMQSVNGDRHLSVTFTAPQVGGAAQGGARRPLGQSDASRRDHWGLARIDVLPGNIGYMKVTGFEGSPAAIEGTSAALKYLEGTDAMIFDFRGMGGGSGIQSNFLISHFVSADTVPSLVVANRSQGVKRTRYTLASVPGMRRPTVPLFVLTDRGTASAGEDFAFVLQQLGRAKVVGDRTAGAGHNNTFVDLGNGFRASISITRVSDARTGKEWERVGVQPDIPSAPDEALAIAHVAALDTLLRSTHDAELTAALSTARLAAGAQAHPHRVPAQMLASYAGTYEGGRVIAADRDVLLYRRDATRPPRAMVTVNDTTFVLNNAIQITFERGADGGVRMVQHLADGSVFALSKVGGVPSELSP